MVDAFSKMVWVTLFATPKGAGIASTWVGLKSNSKVIGTRKAPDSIFKEIAGDLRDESPPRKLQDPKLKAGSDNGSEFTGADIDALKAKCNATHEYGVKGRPMSNCVAAQRRPTAGRRPGVGPERSKQLETASNCCSTKLAYHRETARSWP